jgi:hypothetical protein
MTAKPDQESGRKQDQPGIIERAITGLEEHFERGEHGQETGYERPDVEKERESRDHKLDAEHFQHLTEEHEKEQEEKRAQQRDQAAEKHDRKVKELSEKHVGDQQWDELMHRAREAAKAGLIEFQLARFPSQLCSDGGRAINVNEKGWQKTLRGEPRELYQRWEKELKPNGFHLTAKILDFPQGFPGDAGLFLTWDK